MALIGQYTLHTRSVRYNVEHSTQPDFPLFLSFLLQLKEFCCNLYYCDNQIIKYIFYNFTYLFYINTHVTINTIN